MNETMSGPMITAMLATGNIRKYQLIVGGSQLLNLPLGYVCLACGCAAESVFIVAVVVSCVGMFLRVYMLRNMINLSFRQFYLQIYFRVILVIITSAVIPSLITQIITIDFPMFIMLCFLSIASSATSIYLLGCTTEERNIVKQMICKTIRKI